MAGLKSVFGLAAVAAVVLAAGASASLGQPTKDNKPAQPATTPAPKTAEPPKTPQPAKPAEPAKKPAEPAGQPSAEEKAWMEAGTPGDSHAKLKPFVGEWHAVVKEYMGPTPSESKGKMKNSMAWGGRFLKSQYEGQMGEMEFTGGGLWGYNNLSKQYESTWADSMGTSIAFMTGTCDSDGKVFTLTGESIDPVTKKKATEREVTRLVSPEKYVMEFYRPGPDGKETRVMEITFTKAGKSEADEAEKGKKGEKHEKDEDSKKGKKDEKKSGGN